MSNGIIEGSNNKIKVIKRVSYGYSDFCHLRNRIFYIFNEDEEPRSIPISKDKVDKGKLPYIKKENKIIHEHYLFLDKRKMRVTANGTCPF